VQGSAQCTPEKSLYVTHNLGFKELEMDLFHFIRDIKCAVKLTEELYSSGLIVCIFFLYCFCAKHFLNKFCNLVFLENMC